MKDFSGKARARDWRYFREQEIELDALPSGGHPLWAMLFPATYSVGMASLGFQVIIAEMRALGVGVERFFSGRFRGLSVESGRPISDFPLISASVAYEPDIRTVVSIFREWGVSSSWKERAELDQPIFGIGGALTYINPLIFSKMADYVVLGDGERVLDHLVTEARLFMQHGDRGRFLEGLAEHRSIYVPSLHDPMILKARKVHREKNIIGDLDRVRGKSLWIAPSSVFGKTALVELQRGCRRSCRYCTIPASFGRTRTRSARRILEDLYPLVSLEGVQVGLVSPETGDYPELSELLSGVASLGIPVSFASLRVDNINEEIVSALTRSGRHTLTVAPEAGNDRLRRECGKYFSNDDIIERLSMASSLGIRQVKLYFMTGIPGETSSDVDDIASLCDRVRSEARLRVTASVGIFVPKPMTFWEREKMISERDAFNRLKRLRRLFSNGPAKGCRINIQQPKEAALEFSIAWRGLSGRDGPILPAGRISGAPGPAPEQRSLLLEQLGILGYN